MQSLSRSRDENLLVDIESALRLAQQQAQLTSSAEPLLAALRGADQRLERSGQPRLSRVRAAIARDIDRIKVTSVSDVPGLLVKLDETRPPGGRIAAGQRRRRRAVRPPAARKQAPAPVPVVGARLARHPRGGAQPGARQPHRPARGRAGGARAGVFPAREPQAEIAQRAAGAAGAADRLGARRCGRGGTRPCASISTPPPAAPRRPPACCSRCSRNCAPWNCRASTKRSPCWPRRRLEGRDGGGPILAAMRTPTARR